MNGVTESLTEFPTVSVHGRFSADPSLHFESLGPMVPDTEVARIVQRSGWAMVLAAGHRLDWGWLERMGLETGVEYVVRITPFVGCWTDYTVTRSVRRFLVTYEQAPELDDIC